MKIIIFGATGRTGIPLVRQALGKGHEVTAFVRDKKKLPIQHEKLNVYEGDVIHYSDVEKAIANHDAVLSVIGHTKNTPKNLLATATENIIKAMRHHHIQRLISLTGAGVAVEKDVKQGLISQLFGIALKLIAKDLWQDSMNQKELIVKSNLDWTIVRAPRLTDGNKTEHYQTGYFKFTKPMIPRADVAHFMLVELETNKFLREFPLIGVN